jgi:hypothetical protein
VSLPPTVFVRPPCWYYLWYNYLLHWFAILFWYDVHTRIHENSYTGSNFVRWETDTQEQGLDDNVMCDTTVSESFHTCLSVWYSCNRGVPKWRVRLSSRCVCVSNEIWMWLWNKFTQNGEFLWNGYSYTHKVHIGLLWENGIRNWNWYIGEVLHVRRWVPSDAQIITGYVQNKYTCMDETINPIF